MTFQGAVLLLLSTAALMALHLLQGGIPCLVIPYLLILGYIYRTKQDKRLLFSGISIREYILIGCVIFTSISSGDHYRELLRMVEVDMGRQEPRILIASVLGGLGIMSIPIFVYILSWLKETGSSGSIERCSSFLNHKSFFKLCAALAVLAIAAELYFSCSKSISWDESFSLSIIDSGYDKVLQVTSTDVHPPLYYFILKSIVDTLCGLCPHITTMQAAKIASTLPCIILLLLCLTWVRKHWGNCAAGLGAISICCAPLLLEYAVTVRMYSWLCLFIICCYIQAWRVMRKNTIANWLLFAAFGLMSVYTHYWGGVTVSVIYLYTLIWSIRRGKRTFLKWVLAAVLSVLGYLPWLPTWLAQCHDAIQNGNTLRLIWAYISNIMMYAQDNTLLLLAVVVCVIYSYRAADFRSSAQTKYAYLGVGVFALTLALSIMAVYLCRILLYYRFFIPALMCLWLGISIMVSRHQHHRLRVMVAAIIVSTCIGSLISFANREYKEAKATEQFISFCKPGSTVFFAADPDFSHTVFHLCDADSYSYSKLRISTVMQKVYDKNPLYHAQEAESISQLIQAGKEVYYISRDMHDAKKYRKPSSKSPETNEFAHEQHCVLRDCGAYRLRWYIWHLYRVELPSES